ncbi:hypothetical protein WH87_17120 [Devosia epidermidihirudinis]|uniref:ABC transporter domain-containing protein n=1 Tax=Devosia epidermidihirudinis TaxID=1293439 RepID=A0A0F5Q348_9HYPH|nr:sugar ABC transporter ATP-binding protein [Devosia epidermidihirudinis]KKC35305.1 hypothetical protein WH87_17120 [Devosia epidermidihirudinis]
MQQRLIEMRGISKAYPGVTALRNVDFELSRGEVRALLGKNGAGKSTLIKIMAGVETPDSGDIDVDGRKGALRSPAEGIKAGIATVHQELSIIPEMSVAENIFLGRWPRRAGSIDWNTLNAEAAAILAQLGFNIDPRVSASQISVAQRQLVEIARAISKGAKVLILDEPTSSLVTQEVEVLLAVIQRLSAAGVGIIYISHRMDEIRRIATSVTVLRDGTHIRTAPVDEVSNSDIVKLMLGDATTASSHRAPAGHVAGKAILSATNLAVLPRVTSASFEVRAGEVLGIAGVLGSGRTELLQALVGLRRPASGQMTLEGAAYAPKDLRAALAAGVFMTPEDRRHEGAVTMLGIDENLVMASWASVSKFGIIQSGKMNQTVNQSIAQLGVKLARPGEALANLSGGNQQKVVIGKALNAKPKVLLLDEPTRGVDVGAKGQIYALMRDLATQGLAVVFVSGELEEFPEVCDRVLILRDGQITGEVTGDDVRTQVLLDATMGERRPA